jgi:hypothetical protein
MSGFTGANRGASEKAARGAGSAAGGGNSGLAFNGHRHHHGHRGGISFFAGPYPYGYYDNWAYERRYCN